MRISKTMRWVLGIAIFVIAFISLYVVYINRLGELDQVNDSIVQAQSDLTKSTSEKADWESQLVKINSQISQSQSNLAKAIAELNSTRTSLPKSVQSIEYDEKLVQIAKDSGLELAALNFLEPRNEKAQNITFSVTPVRFNVVGSVSNTLSFIDKIAADRVFFVNTAITAVTVGIPIPLTDDEKAQLTEEEIAKREMPSATIEFAIYTYEGE